MTYDEISKRNRRRTNILNMDRTRAHHRGVRVVYVVPTDAQPWIEAKGRAAEWLDDIQWFFADEMMRLGYGPKTFEVQWDGIGGFPFYQVTSSLCQEAFLGGNVRDHSREAAKEHEFLRAEGPVIYFYEANWFDGRLWAGARSTRGEAFLSSLHLKMARREWLADQRGYAGMVFDWIRPEPMAADTLSWNGRGPALGDLSGSAFGVIAHELGHCFGLPDDKTVRRTRKRHLMNSGCRGMRGYFRPDLTGDCCVLSASDAALLEKNECFAVRPLRPRSISFGDKANSPTVEPQR